jgi:hypothetical protein
VRLQQLGCTPSLATIGTAEILARNGIAGQGHAKFDRALSTGKARPSIIDLINLSRVDIVNSEVAERARVDGYEIRATRRGGSSSVATMSAAGAAVKD